MQKKSVYLDYAAATPIRKEVLKAMSPFFQLHYGNPSSIYSKGRFARVAIDQARVSVAKILNVNFREIIFTGSGTESINLAIQGVFRAYGEAALKEKKVPVIITSNAEHSAVLNTCKYLEKFYSCKVIYLPVDTDGKITGRQVEKVISDCSKNEVIILTTIMYANNEIGTINNISEIGAVCKKHSILFHTDACQAADYLTIDVKKLNVDLLTLNGSKIYGPKGVGILYKNDSVKLVPLFFGGEGQEHRLRSGTENVAAIIGFAKALEIVQNEKEKEIKRLKPIRLLLEKELLSIPNSVLNGAHDTVHVGSERLINNVNITFQGAEGEMLLIALDEAGLQVSTGSACTSGAVEPSYVLTAIGRSKTQANCSIRLSIGKFTTKSDITFAISAIKKAVKKLRENSPLYGS